MMRLGGVAGIAAALLLTAGPSHAVADVSDLALEDGRMQRVLHASPAHPHATLLMLPGGTGMVEFGPDGSFRRMGDGFLLRTLPLWQARGFATAVLSPPNGMSLLGYRHTKEYAAVIGQAAGFLRSRENVPIWLVGISQGTTAAIGAAARLPDGIAGVVIMSPVTGRSSAGETLFDSEPDRVAVPVLIVVNGGDTCPASPPAAAKAIGDALASAPHKEVLALESAALRGHPCGGEAPHGFWGIEPETVERVAEWIIARSER